MNYLLAKKKRTDNTFFNILSQEDSIYDIPDFGNHRNYEVDLRLDEEEWFGIPHFNTTEYTIEFLKQNFNSAEHHQIRNSEYEKIKYFLAYQDDDYFCFQRFTYSNIINKRWFSLNGEPEIKKDEPIIILKKNPDAIYKKSTDTLYFRNLIDAKNIFPNLIKLYKEATDEETESFLNNDFISLYNDFNKNKVNKSNRQRIALISEILSTLSEGEVLQIHNYIKEYCPELEYSEENKKFSIGNENDLKNLLFGIDERYYTTGVKKEKRLANSVMKLANIS